MKVAYVTSMFPCWSETFILNEMVDHRRAGIELAVYSLKRSSETMVHDEALPFLPETVYPRSLFDPRLWFLHASLAIGRPVAYFRILGALLALRGSDPRVKLKALAVFLLSPVFVRASVAGRVDHVHAHFATYPALLAWIIGRFTGIGYTVTAHAHDIYVNQDLLPLVFREAKKIVAISEFNKRFIVEKMGRGIENSVAVVHCGIDTDSFPFAEDRPARGAGNGTMRILSIGRLSGIKGFPYLLEALRLLADEGIAFTCDIIGEGPQRGELERRIRSLGLEGRVNLLGARKSDEIPRYLKQSDLFVLACATDRLEGHDGIPVVFMEAMALGTPVIGTRLSGIPELIRHGETGICALPENPESLKESIREYLANPAGTETMRRRARALVDEEFNIARNCIRLREVFTEGKMGRRVGREGAPA